MSSDSAEPDNGGGPQRLQKVLAAAGVGSRRICEDLIAAGRVTVDGEVATLGDKADPTAVIHVDGDRVLLDQTLVHLAFNKPRGVVSTMSDEKGRAALAEYVAMVPQRVYHVGRLDVDSEGLLLLCDDGTLQARIADPRFKMAKTYLVQVEGEPGEGNLERLRGGVLLKDGPTRPAEVERIDAPELWPRDPPIRVRKSVPDSWLKVTIREGRNRQVRRMTAAVGLPTLRLVRWAVGEWTVAGLAPGEWREVMPPVG